MFRKFYISNRLPNRYFPKIVVGCPWSVTYILIIFLFTDFDRSCIHFIMVSFGPSRFFSFVNSWFLQINLITTGADQFRYYKLQIKVLVIAIIFVASKNLREGIRIWTKLTERKPHKMNTSNLLAITRHDKKQSSKYFGEKSLKFSSRYTCFTMFPSFENVNCR